MASAADGPGVSDDVAGGLAATDELDDSELDLFVDPTPGDGPLITIPTMSPAPCSETGTCSCPPPCYSYDHSETAGGEGAAG